MGLSLGKGHRARLAKIWPYSTSYRINQALQSLKAINTSAELNHTSALGRSAGSARAARGSCAVPCP